MKAFLFDVDDTLYDQLQPFQRAYLKMFGEPEGVDLERLFSQSRKRGDEVFEASQLGTISMEEMYIYRTQKSFADLELFISPDQALAFQAYYQEFQQKIFLSEECRSMLADLKGRVRLGIITNGPGAHQRNKVKRLEWRNGYRIRMYLYRGSFQRPSRISEYLSMPGSRCSFPERNAIILEIPMK